MSTSRVLSNHSTFLWPTDPTCNEFKSVPEVPTQAIEPVADRAHEEERPFELLIPEVLQLLIQDGENATVIIRDAISAEQRWQKLLSERLSKEHDVLNELETRRAFAQKASDVVPSLCLAAGGVMAIMSSGALSFSFIPMGAVALGGLLALDTILDNPMKKALVAWLGARSETDTKSRLQTICVATNFLTFGLGSLVNTASQLIIRSAGEVAADVASASTQ